MLITGPVYRLYEWWLHRQIDIDKAPRHVGLILDGNRRYARARNLPPWYGHREGAERVIEVLKYLWESGVKVVTLYTFSIENFQRRKEEVSKIMEIAKEKFSEVITNPDIHKYKCRIQAIGRVDLLPLEVQKAIHDAEEATKDYNDHVLNIAIGYSGRAEIVDAFKKLAEKVKKGEIKPEDIDEHLVEMYLYTRGLPDPDLIIRTSGEERLSGFLLWQSAYSELYFSQIYWPEVRRIDVWRAIRSYTKRGRRFGK